ncbi:segregation/condensation protein A [Ruania alkalisoli]|uniref:Segregation and condensation protein A n=1 Tax=Ruania alkalisoli TaxID=2779775 RepID=A0A7M1SXX8_9MICO|nr:segregation/condensation protein A [Ruania alkalisoli]
MATWPEGAQTLPDAEAPPPDGVAAASTSAGGTFEVHLTNFTGPFDLLLSLIAKHKMDVTEVALAVVTDDFIAHIRAQEEWDLSQASEFLVIASTLLDLKAARLLPRGTVEDAEDLELLEARDLLFARLLQYRAFKEVAAFLGSAWERAGRSHPREAVLEPRFAALLPELIMQIGPTDLAVLAARALAPKPAPAGVDIAHLHNPAVSVREQAAHIVDRLRRSRSLSFRALTDDADGTAVVVARFLALLELFREGAVGFDQAGPLGDLTVRWTGSDDGEVDVDDDYEDPEITEEPNIDKDRG